MPHDALTKITPKTPKEYIWDQKEVKTTYVRLKIFKIKVLAKVKNKTKFVFQAISHCNSESGRDLITKRMSKLIKLDLVGDCYGVYCDLECYNRELENHLFYLAFENNICQNYVTENFGIQ
uniref:Fucosyltransferase n=1 Tax=Meloidogyne enterolobii TaxID=390850 RepID=A0A6V7VX03_MELEN|nr:unnamed protein product [Meloidogyne enterolobii]